MRVGKTFVRQVCQRIVERQCSGIRRPFLLNLYEQDIQIAVCSTRRACFRELNGYEFAWARYFTNASLRSTNSHSAVQPEYTCRDSVEYAIKGVDALLGQSAVEVIV